MLRFNDLLSSLSPVAKEGLCWERGRGRRGLAFSCRGGREGGRKKDGRHCADDDDEGEESREMKRGYVFGTNERGGPP